MKLLKDLWFSVKTVFKFSCWLALDGLHIHICLLDINLKLDLSLPEWLRLKVFRYWDSFWCYGWDELYGRPLASLDLDWGFDELLITGFSFVWEAHDHGCEHSIKAGLLGLYGDIEYWSGLGWDTEQNKYFVLTPQKQKEC